MNHRTPQTIPRWVRIALVALGLPNVLAGVWAIADPRGWYDGFPGFGADLVAAEPPYSAHLATDAGAGLLASGLILVVAAWLARTDAVRLALVGFAAFAIPHAGYHVFNPAPGLTGTEDLQSAGILVFTAVAAVVLFVFAGRSPAADESSEARPADRTEIPA